MIIRFNGANSGIKQYLENGITKDRPFDRDQLDERIILNGDLELVDKIINQIDDSGQKYYHITLAFKEDYIDKKMLQEITKEFNDFFLNAYTDDELVYYAEAHLPKIKSYHDRKTGDVIERKPHIHVVIPQINLLTNTRFGFPYEKYQDYISAFQEYINCKYGLESPKDNRRNKFNQYSEVISRYKGDNFNGPNSDLKKALLDRIIEHKINSYDEFISLVKSEYVIRIRNENVANKMQYLNIKNNEMQRGVNLKEYVFSREFLDLPFEEKIRFFDEKFNDKIKYIDVGLPKPIRLDYIEKLKEWNELVSYGEKYINVGGSKKDRMTYNNLTDQGKGEFLKQKRYKYYSKHHERIEHAGRELEANYSRECGAYLRSIIEYTKSPEYDGRSFGEIARKVNSIGRNIKAVIISRRTRDIEQGKGAEIGRVPADSQSVEYDNGRNRYEVKTSVLNQLVSEYNDAIYNKFDNNNIQANSKYLAADILLELVSRTHGVVPEKYLITKAYDGSDRINCGSKNYNVSDFLTKELNLRYTEASAILQTALQMQHEIYIEMGYDPQKKPYLFGEYKKWLLEYKVEKEKKYNQYKHDIRQQRADIRELHKQKLQQLRDNKSITYYAREKAIRVLKAELVKELSLLSAAVSDDWVSLRKQSNLELQNAYRTFLAEKALADDNLALQELRRLRVDFEQYKKSGEIRHVDRYEEYRLNFDYKIDVKTGDIIYSINGNNILRDVGRRLDILDANNDSINIALNLAIQKFGTNLYLVGSDEFKKQIIEYAFTNGYKLTYKDEFSLNYQNDLKQKLEIEGRYKQLHLENKSRLKENYINLLGTEALSIEKKIKTRNNVNRFLEAAVGEVIDFGWSDEKRSKDKSKSYYIMVKDQNGEVKTVRGDELANINVSLGEYVYLAKVKQDKLELSASLYHKIERFINNSHENVYLTKRDIANLKDIIKNSRLDDYRAILVTLVEGKISDLSQKQLLDLLNNTDFRTSFMNEWEKVVATKNYFDIEKIDTQELMDKAVNNYELYCKNLLNTKTLRQVLNVDKINLKDMVILSYEKAFVNSNNNIPHETCKMIVYSIKDQKSTIVYSDKLLQIKALHQFEVGDLVNINIEQPVDNSKIYESNVSFQLQQRSWLDKVNYKFKDNLIKIKDNFPEFNRATPKMFGSDLAIDFVKENIVKYNLSNDDRVGVKLVLNDDKSGLCYIINNIVYSVRKQRLYKDIFNQYADLSRQDFMDKFAYTDFTKFYSQSGIVTKIDSINNSITLSQPYMGDGGTDIYKKLSFTDEQFNKIAPQASVGKFVYIGRTFDTNNSSTGSETVMHEWGLKTLNINHDTKRVDIFKQVNYIKNELATENNISLEDLNSIERVRMGKVEGISHNPALGLYYIKIQMLSVNKSFYMEMDQKSAIKYINSGELEVGKYIYATPVKEIKRPDFKYEKSYDILVKDNNLDRDAKILYDIELEKQITHTQERTM